MTKLPPRRIIISGTSCTGKTTLGRTLADRLGLPQIDLDDLHFLPNWVEKERETFIAEVDALTPKDGEWIVSGSYQSKLKDTLWPKATLIIWLDLPLRIILTRYFLRTYRRVVHKQRCCGDNYETLRHVLFTDNMLKHIFKTYWARKVRLKEWRNNLFANTAWIVPATPREVDALLTSPLLQTEPLL